MIFVFAGVSNSEVYASGNASCESLKGQNINGNNYSYGRYGKTVESYLVDTGTGYMRVQGNVTGQGMVASYYDYSLSITERKNIPAVLPIFGAFYETSSNYYIVSGQDNTEENNSKEVFRITKYDKNWNKIKSCGLYGANTIHPFDAGSCRISHIGKHLVIRTAHEMYTSDDGLNHQANVTIQVNTDTMVITDSYTGTGGNYCGYVSHSFNQFIKLEDNKIVAVDHGDAYPRSICLMKYPTDVTTGSFQSNNVTTIDVLTIPGSIGNNNTGATVGGFEISNSAYLIAGNSIAEGSTNLNGTRNIFVAAVNKTNNTVQKTWLTDYSAAGDEVGNPFLVKLSADSYMVLWGKDETVYYTKVSGNGQKVGQTYSMEGYLSDCVPIVSNNNIIWYTWNNAEEVFYKIPLGNLSNPTTVSAIYGHDYELLSANGGLASVKCNKCNAQNTVKVPTGFSIYWNNPATDGMYYYSSPTGAEVGQTVEYWIRTVNYANVEADEVLEDLVFESSDPANCIINSVNETVKFKDAGRFTITVYPKYNPSVRNSYTINVTKPLESVALTSNLQSPQNYGKAIKFTATPNGGKGTLNYEFTVTNSNGAVVKEQTGKSAILDWTPSAAGTYQAKVKVTDSFDQKTVEKQISYNIQRAPLSDATIVLSADSFEYNGSVQNPNVRSVSYEGKTLTANVDYKITNSTASKDKGSYNLIIEGLGNFSGTVYKQFSIVEKQLTADMLTVTSSNLVYNTEVQTPGVVVRHGEKILTKGVDYTVSGGAKNAGSYNVVIEAVTGSNYSGSASKPYEIAKKPVENSMIKGVEDRVFDGSYIAPGFSVVYKGENVTKEILDLGGGKDAGTYTIRIRGKDNYTGEASKSYKVNPKDINDEYLTEEAVLTYTGEQKKPSLRGGELTLNDYTVEYDNQSDGIDVGTYEVTVVGRNNYTGTRRVNVSIIEKSIRDSDVIVEPIPNQYYTGDEIRPTVVIKYNNRNLNENDYTIEYNDNVEIGEASITIEGIGNYKKSREVRFDIVEKLADPEPQTPVDETDPTAGLSGDDKTKVNDISKALGVTAEEAVAINNYAKANGISMDTLKITEAAITRGNTDSDLKGSAFGQLQTQAKKNTKSAVTLSWKKIPKADGYLVFGNKCGTNNKMKLLKAYTSGSACSFIQKNLKKGTYYKYIVIAYKNIGGKKITINASPTIHTVTKGGKFGVAKSVKVTKVGKKKGAKATINKGKTAKITAKEVKADKKIKNHRKLAYETSNPKVATVSKKGVVKAIGKGSCKIFVYAQNGKQKTVSITVK